MRERDFSEGTYMRVYALPSRSILSMSTLIHQKLRNKKRREEIQEVVGSMTRTAVVVPYD